MSVTVIGTTQRGGSASGTTTSHSVVRDASTLTGDLVVVAFIVKNSKTGPTISAPDGSWTALTLEPTGSGTNTGNEQVFYKTATTDGTQTYTFTVGISGATSSWLCQTLRGTSGTPTIIGVTAGTTAQSVPTAAISSGSLTENSEFILRIIGGTVSSGSTSMTGSAITWDAACTKLLDVQGAGSGTSLAWESMAYEYGPNPAANIPARTITLSNAPNAYLTMAIGIPAATGGGNPPANVSLPAISTDGTPQTGETITCSTGSWNNSPTSYAYQWSRNGSTISGATSSAYVLIQADEGTNITCTVTATNTSGSTSATSTAIVSSAAPTTPAPINDIAPAITTDGTPQVGETVTVSTGTWENSPTSYTYQWLRNGSPISSAVTNSYTLTTNDVGTGAISCAVTATNGGGSTTANTASISPAAAAASWHQGTLYHYYDGTWV